MGRPDSADVRYGVGVDGRAPEDIVSSASERAFKMEAHPPPTGGSPMPRAPTASPDRNVQRRPCMLAVHPEWLAACCGGRLTSARVGSNTTSGRSHGQCPASIGENLAARARG